METKTTKIATILQISNRTINQMLLKCAIILNEVISAQVLWHPVWRAFNIEFINSVYVPFESGEKYTIAFRSDH